MSPETKEALKAVGKGIEGLRTLVLANRKDIDNIYAHFKAEREARVEPLGRLQNAIDGLNSLLGKEAKESDAPPADPPEQSA